ncbi:MAG: Asp23/Gls24 family envelope stress response protein [Oscillospiraceae bacterium]|jgi:uncharacterized alkaline shock family protein YloU|nr:Asp23/Gls24 family envelope stress response protein [Oscillospiraceae bacterium]
MYKIRTDIGDITITHDVFTTLAGIAAASCFGVRGMAVRSVTDGLVHLLKREAMGRGVKVSLLPAGQAGNTEDEKTKLQVEIHIIAKTGVNIPVICESIVSAVSYKLVRDTGLPVKNVDVFVDGIMVD